MSAPISGYLDYIKYINASNYGIVLYYEEVIIELFV